MYRKCNLKKIGWEPESKEDGRKRPILDRILGFSHSYGLYTDRRRDMPGIYPEALCHFIIDQICVYA